MLHTQRGFTIVELLIVIVVIAILAAISVVAYSGIQDRARKSKIENDLALFQKAIIAARVNAGEKNLYSVTGSYGSAGSCVSYPSGTDLSNKTAAPACWSRYDTTMSAISTVSGIDVRSLVDPWGRPYYLDENENEGGQPCGSRDHIGVYPRPLIQSSWATTNTQWVPYITAGC